jgi:hypothetical protein
MKTSAELIEYIDHIIASLNADYIALYDTTRTLMEKVPQDQRSRLEWNLVHQHTNLHEFINDLKRHQEILSKEVNAGKKVQD